MGLNRIKPMIEDSLILFPFCEHHGCPNIKKQIICYSAT